MSPGPGQSHGQDSAPGATLAHTVPLGARQEHFVGFSPEAYEETWFYKSDSPYQDFLTQQFTKIVFVKEGTPSPEKIELIDLGAGSCNFSKRLARELELRSGRAQSAAEKSVRLVCVEPSATLLGAPDADALVDEKVCATAEQYFESRAARASCNDGGGREEDSESPQGTVIVIKEVIHHVDCDRLFARIADEYSGTKTEAGRGKTKSKPLTLIIMTRPATITHMPFFEAARKNWERMQEKPERYREALERAFAQGGEKVEIVSADYEVRMPRSQWRRMCRSRFWSNLNGITDEEIAAGLDSGVEWKNYFGDPMKVKTMEQVEFEEDPMLAFPDKIVFVVARIGGS
eukprot:g17649.t1